MKCMMTYLNVLYKLFFTYLHAPLILEKYKAQTSLFPRTYRRTVHQYIKNKKGVKNPKVLKIPGPVPPPPPLHLRELTKKQLETT
jgi:hypothetical protein